MVPFALLFGLSMFGTRMGPTFTTLILAAELYPTSIRSTFHGLSSGVAKVGAFIGALTVPLILAGPGLRIVTLVSGCCFAAALATTFLVDEPNGRTLDELGGETMARHGSRV